MFAKPGEPLNNHTVKFPGLRYAASGLRFLFDHAGLLGAGEAHGQQHQFTADLEAAARDFIEDDAAGFALHFHLDHVQFPEVAMFVADELDIGFYGSYYVRVIGIFRELCDNN